MSLWGKQDALAVTGTSIDVTNADATVTGTGTAFDTQVKNGDTLIISGVKYKVLNVASATELELASVYEGETATVVVANVKIQQTPKFLNTTEKRGTYGIDATEVHAGGDDIVEIGIQSGGTKYKEVPVVTIDAPASGTTGTATVTISGGAVNSVTITENGSGYTADPAVAVGAPFITFNAATALDDTTEVLTYAGHLFETGDAVVYDNGGGTSIGGLTDGTTYYVVKTGANTMKLAASLADATAATPVTIDLTDGVGAAHTLTLTSGAAVLLAQLGSGTPASVTNPGWILRTVGTGGRAGRVQQETLVAGRTLVTGDAADDAQYPDA